MFYCGKDGIIEKTGIYEMFTQDVGVACHSVCSNASGASLFCCTTTFYLILFGIFFPPTFHFILCVKELILKGVSRGILESPNLLTGQLWHHFNHHLQIRTGLLNITEEASRFLFSRRYDLVNVWINSTLCKQITFILNTRKIYMYWLEILLERMALGCY